MGSRHRRAALAVLAVLAIAAMAASASLAAPAAKPKPKPVPSFQLRIGTVLPFTGAISGFGPSLDASARLATSTIDAALKADNLSKKISVKIVDSQDDQSSMQPAIEAATKEVKVDKVSVIIGTMSSQSTIAMAQAVTIPNDIVVITPTSSAPQITNLKDNNTVWRILPSDLFQGKAMATAVADAFGKTATINVGARNDAFGTALQQMFVDTWKANGGKIGTEVNWDPTQATFDSEAQKLVSGNPDGWVIIDYPETFAKVGPALVRTGKWSPAKTFMNDVMSVPASLQQVGAPATTGLRGVAPTSQSNNVKQTAAFAKLFKAKYPSKPVTGYEGTSFDAVMLSFLAALQGRSASPNAIKANLRGISGPAGKPVTYLNLAQAIKWVLAGQRIAYRGVWGPIDYDKNGDVGSSLFKVWHYDGTNVTTLKIFKYGGK